MISLWEQVKNLTSADFLALYAPIWGLAALKLIGIYVLCRVLTSLGRRALHAFFGRIPDQNRSRTLRTLCQSILTYGVYFFAIIAALDIAGFTISVTSIMATAGIGGLALGFGAQNLVRDVVTGFFLLFEDQYAVGEMVTLCDVTGTVTAITLRTTQIKGSTGELSTLPNGNIQKVVNYSRSGSLAVVDIDISQTASISHAQDVLEQACLRFAHDERTIEPPAVLGVIQTLPGIVRFRTTCKTHALKHWELERELRKAQILALQENDVAH